MCTRRDSTKGRRFVLSGESRRPELERGTEKKAATLGAEHDIGARVSWEQRFFITKCIIVCVIAKVPFQH